MECKGTADGGEGEGGDSWPGLWRERGPGSGIPATAPLAIRLHAYQDRARRDAAPRSGAADWSQTVDCGAARDTASMYRGEERVFDTSVRAGDVLGGTLPEGRYYFVLELRAQDDRVFLSAGDAPMSRPRD